MAAADELRHEVGPVLCPASQAVHKHNGRSGATRVVVNAMAVYTDEFTLYPVEPELYLYHRKEQIERAQAGKEAETDRKRDEDEQRSLQYWRSGVRSAGRIPVGARRGHGDYVVRIVHRFVRRPDWLVRRVRMTCIVYRIRSGFQGRTAAILKAFRMTSAVNGATASSSSPAAQRALAASVAQASRPPITRQR